MGVNFEHDCNMDGWACAGSIPITHHGKATFLL